MQVKQTKIINELARATENDKLKLSIDNGDIADTTESVKELTDELLKSCQCTANL